MEYSSAECGFWHTSKRLLPRRVLPESVQFSVAKSVQFSIAIDTVRRTSWRRSQESPHEVREQILVPTDGCVDPDTRALIIPRSLYMVGAIALW